MITYFGLFYIVVGLTFILIPLVYIELGRPKDFIRAGLNLAIGITLVFKNRVLENSYPAIYFLITMISIFYMVEIFLNRWNQLTDNEKNKLTTLLELKKNLSKVSDAFSLSLGIFTNPQNLLKFESNNQDTIKKKWVRKDQNDNIKDSKKKN